MQLKALVTSALVASAAAEFSRCAAPEPTDEQIDAARQMQIEELDHFAATGEGMHIDATISTRVYWHVIATSQTVAGGWISNATLDEQFDVLNERFAPHGISFTEGGRDWTINSAWAQDSAEIAMKTALRKGTYADMNVYFLPGTDYLGYAYLPQTVTSGSTAFIRDGLVIESGTVPGGADTGYNLGLTVVHEAGHFLGLYHTFQGGCGASGDLVSDTPPEASAASGCPTGRDTCSGGGVDPIHNYMDYSNDPCYEEFTAGQQTRIFSQWNTYRAQYQ